MKHWFLVYCKPKQENRAKINLQQQGVPVFYPILSRRKTPESRLITQALFPRYIFVRIDPTINSFSTIKYTRGICDFVRFGERIQRVPENVVEQLMNKQEVAEECDFNSGDKVLLNTDLYKNVEAIYQQADGETRSILLMKLLNRDVAIVANNCDFQQII